MAFKKWFGKKEEEGNFFDPTSDYTLATMRVGYLVDFEGETFEVTGYSTFDYDGYPTEEWVLTSSDKVCYLEREDDDGEIHWTFTLNISIADIDGDVAVSIMESEDSPETLTYNGDTYNLTDSGAGLYKENGEGPGEEFISWAYREDSERLVLVVTQWGERDFKAAAGMVVNEYEFTNILPKASRN